MFWILEQSVDLRNLDRKNRCYSDKHNFHRHQNARRLVSPIDWPMTPPMTDESGPQMIPVPDVDANLEDIFEFALTYKGYELNGDEDTGFQNCADIANSAKRDWYATKNLPTSLHDLRSCLFFEQRRNRHSGGTLFGSDDFNYLVGLVSRIREISGGFVEFMEPW